MEDLVGKVAFITGGASGMGLAMARAFSAAGMKVVVADIEQAALDQVDAEFASRNAELLTVRVDVTDRADMAAAAAATEARFGKVHVLVNNAGVAVGGPLDAMSFEDWDWVLGVNLDGVVNGLQTFVPLIKQHGEGGHIINTASMAGYLSIPGLGVYNASKWAVVGISETLRADLEPHNVGVSVLCPGVVNTNIFNSERNRPEPLASTAPGATNVLLPGDDVSEDEQARRARILEGALDPAAVGEMVVHALKTNELYIFTHPELQENVNARLEGMADAFDRWRTYRAEHD